MADFHAHMSDADIAQIILAATDRQQFGAVNRAVEVAVGAGRLIGKREGLEPLDDGLRTVIEGALEHVRKHDPGMVGLILNLDRLHQWLQRYPCRGRPIDTEQEPSA